MTELLKKLTKSELVSKISQVTNLLEVAESAADKFKWTTTLKVLNEFLGKRNEQDQVKELKKRNKQLHKEIRAEVRRRKQLQKQLDQETKARVKFMNAYARQRQYIIKKAKRHARKILAKYRKKELALKRENTRLRKQDSIFKREVNRQQRKLYTETQRQLKRDEKQRQKQAAKQKRQDRIALNKMMKNERSWNASANRRAKQQWEADNRVELISQTESYKLYRYKNLFAKNVEVFLTTGRQKVLDVLETEGPNKKVVYVLKIVMAKKTYDNNRKVVENTQDQFISSNVFTLLDQNDMESSYDSLTEFFNKHLNELELNGSGWYLKSINHLDIKLSEYNPMRGGCYTEKLPVDLANGKSVLQIQNKDDNQCLKWALSYQTLASPPTTNKYRVSKQLLAQSKTLNFKGVEFPSCQKDLAKFERNNPKYLVYCYGLDDKDKYFIYYKNRDFHDLQKQRQVLNVLYYKNHFYPIINLDIFHKYSYI